MLYQALDSSKDEIRLLTIHFNDNTSAPLACSLSISSLAERPSFQSLSYAWGKAATSVSLKVGSDVLPITQNLADALYAVRGRCEPVSLWVDAICINQQDIAERNQQVQLMKKIYTSATRVNVWLGQAFAGVDVAFLMLTRLAKGTPLRALLVAEDSRKAPKRLDSLTRIFTYAWWQRLWVIQEVLLADKATLYCGQHCIDFRTIMQAFESLWNEYISSGQQLRQLCGTESIENLVRQLEKTVRRLHIIHSFVFYHTADSKRLFRDSPATLPFLLHTCSWSQATNPRDKVYGALGLLPNVILEPDYSLSVSQVFTRCTYDMMKHMGNLTFLTQVDHDSTRNQDLPSWVPDWTHPSVLTAPFLVFYEFYNANRKSFLDIRLTDDIILQVGAVTVDEVDEVGKPYDHQGCSRSADLPAIIKPIMTDWQNLFERHWPSVGSEEPPDLIVEATNDTGISSLALTYLESPRAGLANRTDLPAYAIQSASAPLYHDADHSSLRPGKRARTAVTRSVPTYSTLPRSKTLPIPQLMQSITAPLYYDADYSIITPHKAHSIRRNVPSAISMPVQSREAPLYGDSDYQRQLSRSSPRPAMGQDRAGSYKTYDTFSHSYVISNSERSSPGAWYPWSRTHLLIWLAKHRFSWTWQIAVKRLNIQGAEFLLRARTDLPALLTAVSRNVLALERGLAFHDDAQGLADHRAELSRLAGIIAQDFGIHTQDGSDPYSSNMRPPSYLQPLDNATPDEAPRRAAFWRTLCMDVIDCQIFQKHRRCAEPDGHRVQEWLDWIEGKRTSDGIPQLHWHLNTVLQRKRMFTTKGGHVGLAAQDVRPGDKICILAGEAYPYVLRPVTDDANDERWRLVCPCYAHGLMGGEAFRREGEQPKFSTISIA